LAGANFNAPFGPAQQLFLQQLQMMHQAANSSMLNKEHRYGQCAHVSLSLVQLFANTAGN
jgi:hypothetical protein